MSINLWEPQEETPEPRFVHLEAAEDGNLALTIVDKDRNLFGVLAEITEDGLKVGESFTRDTAARAGLTNALDANGRLKVIGQEVEAAKAELVGEVKFTCATSSPDSLIVRGYGGAKTGFGVDECGQFAEVDLSPEALRKLHTVIGKRLAYLEQEGLA